MATESPAVPFLSSMNELAAGLERKYVEKYEEQKILIQKLQQEIDEMRNYDQIDNILDEIEEIEQKYDDDNIQTNNMKMLDCDEDNAENESDDDDDGETVHKTAQFWDQLEKKLKEDDLEYIKDLVRRNELTMDENGNSTGSTLLMFATHYGKYDLVCLFLPCLDIKTYDKRLLILLF